MRYAELLLVAILTATAVVAPTAAEAQAPSGAGAGIWIAGPDGELRRARPVAEGIAVAMREPAAVRSTRIVFEVEHHARSAAGAVAGSELAAARVASALAAFGIARADIRTETAFVEPRRERRLLAASWERSRVTHFEAGQLVTVDVRDPRRLGLLVDHALGAGATRVLRIDEAAPR
jgi:uncharacterized protein YggE